MSNEGCISKVFTGIFAAIFGLAAVMIIYAIPDFLVLGFINSNFLIITLFIVIYAIKATFTYLCIGSIISPRYKSGTTEAICPSVFRTVVGVIVSLFYEIFGFMGCGLILQDMFKLEKVSVVTSNIMVIVIALVLIATTVITAIRNFRDQDKEWYEQYSKRTL